MESLYLIGVAAIALFAFILRIVLFNFFGLWLRARIANAPVGIGKMVGRKDFGKLVRGQAGTQAGTGSVLSI